MACDYRPVAGPRTGKELAESALSPKSCIKIPESNLTDPLAPKPVLQSLRGGMCTQKHVSFW